MHTPIKWILYYLILLLASKSAISQVNPDRNNRFHIAAGPIIAKETFKWSIAGDQEGQNPNILSEITYSNLYKAGYNIAVGYRFLPKVKVTGTFHQLYIYKGNSSDIDYAEDNRSTPTTILYYPSKKGKENRYRIAMNYDLLRYPKIELQSAAGYYSTNQDYYMHNELKSDINTVYTASWKAPFIYLSGVYKLNHRLYVHANMEASYIFYNAKADWILRYDFKHPISFTHRARGLGMDGTIGFEYVFSPLFKLQLDGYRLHWKTGAGTDMLYMTTGEILSTRMNTSLKTQTGIALNSIISF